MVAVVMIWCSLSRVGHVVQLDDPRDVLTTRKGDLSHGLIGLTDQPLVLPREALLDGSLSCF